MQGISAYARSVAPTPAWRENGRNVRKLNESGDANRTPVVLAISKRLLNQE
jgi:hypothetical protein